MRVRIPLVSAAAAAAATAVLVAGAGIAGARTTAGGAFTASFAGRAIVQAGSSTANITAVGTGTSTIGKVTLAGKGVGANSTPCPTFLGTGVITTADKKSSITFAIVNKATACVQGAADSKINAVVGTSTVKAGTGKYAKAKGTFKFTGLYDRGKGTYTVKFTGTITY